MLISLIITKEDVFKEVAQTAEYTGDKMVEDDGAYDRIRIVDENRAELQRFWNETRAELVQSMIRLLKAETETAGNYVLELNVSQAFDLALVPSMEVGLFSYFVQSIAGKWYVYANKKEAADFVERGRAMLEEVKEKAYYKKPPERPTYD